MTDAEAPRSIPIQEEHDLHGIFGRALPDGTPYVSPSQVGTLLGCPAKWGFTYLEGIQGDPSLDLLIGSAVHAGMELILKEELDDMIPEDPPLAAQEEAMRYMQHDADVSEFDEEALTEAREKAAECVRALADWWLQSRFKVLDVEGECIQYRSINGVEAAVRGFYDVLVQDDQGRVGILDWKTAGRAPTMKKDENGDPTGEYELSRNHAFAVLTYADGLMSDPENADLVVDFVGTVTVTKAKTPKVCAAFLDVTDHLLDWSRAVSSGAVGLILSRNLYPNPSSFLCSERFCAAWNVCPGSGAHLEAA